MINYDYFNTLLNYNVEKVKLSKNNLLDKAIAAVITDDLFFANNILAHIQAY